NRCREFGTGSELAADWGDEGSARRHRSVAKRRQAGRVGAGRRHRGVRSARPGGRDGGQRVGRGRRVGQRRVRRRGRRQRVAVDPPGRARGRCDHVRVQRRRGVRGRPHLRWHDPALHRGARLVSIHASLATAIRAHEPVALVTVIDGLQAGAKLLVRPDAETLGTLGDPELDRVAHRDALAELEAGRSGVRHYGPHGETTPEDLVDTPVIRVFVESWAPPPQMWIFGAVDFTAALAKVAKVLGYRVTVCDAREIFATRRRFPMADEVRVTWPTPMFDERGNALGPRDAVCILTHDPKFDVPAVQGALATQVGYIGVMGSRTTHAKRMER